MKYILILFVYISIQSQASNITPIEIKLLAKHKTWLKLLHYDKKTKQSSIITKDFFLSKHGKTNPELELIETINAYDKIFNDHNHTRCKFPARYLWLSRQIDLNNYTPIDSKCKKLSRWHLMQDISSISAVFVSGFLGNPASAFGHSFLKINKNTQDENNLFDSTISYGAKLPKTYTMISYMYNGLTGGYNAAYSDKYYYIDDIAYSNQEFREMWEYKLNLDKNKRDFLLLHLWELQKQDFKYFFFNRNCGYKISELLELVYEEDVIDSANIWYAPIETFYKLEKMNADHDKSIIDSIHYIPSKQQKIYALYDGLNDSEKRFVNKMVIQTFNKFPLEYHTNTQNSKIKILDFLLNFYAYKKADTESIDNRNIQQSQHKILLERLTLPIMKYKKNKPNKKISITQGNKPRFFGLGVNISNEKKTLDIRYVPFAIEAVGYNGFDGDILRIFDTTISFQKDKIYIKKFDFLKIRRLKTQRLPFDIDSPFSWNLHLGMEKENKREYFADAGAGYSWQLYKNINLYSMLNMSIHTNEQLYRLHPNIGLYTNFNTLRVNIEYGYENRISAQKYSKNISVNLQYKINKALSAYIDFEKKSMEHTSFGLKWYF